MKEATGGNWERACPHLLHMVEPVLAAVEDGGDGGWDWEPGGQLGRHVVQPPWGRMVAALAGHRS